MPMTDRDQSDWLELLALEGAYSATFDTRDGDGWAALFTEDGSYEGRQYGQSAVYTGHEELSKVCAEFPFHVAHMIYVPHFVIGDDEAVARMNLSVALLADGSAFGHSMVQHGYYDVRYRRTAAGWRIHRRVSQMLTTTEIHHGESVSPIWQLGQS